MCIYLNKIIDFAKLLMENVLCRRLNACLQTNTHET